MDKHNWLTYHGSFKGWHYSALEQVDMNNVKNLKVAWIHTPSASKRGIQSFPVVADGILYYTSSSGQVWALDGATGKFIWKYGAKIDWDLVPLGIGYSRGLAVGYGKLYLATVDGRIIALDLKTGSEVWNKAIRPTEGIKAFTGAPLIVKDKVLIGAVGGDLSGCCGPIYAVNAHNGEIEWQFDTIGADERSRASWGNDSWKVGGGGGWMTGTYDSKTNSVWWGTANPAPDYDGAGNNWMTESPRPGANLYTSSVVVLDADTGKLKAYYQEIPHDAWDFDSSVGEFVQIDRGGQRYMLHANKGGILFVYNADPAQAGAGQVLKVENATVIGKTLNYIKGVNPKTGELIQPRRLPLGKHTNLCPLLEGVISWNSGSYNPGTGLYYKVTQEWCADIEILKVDRPANFSGELYFGASWTVKHPEGRQAFGTLQARDPITHSMKWELEMKYPSIASLLSTKSGLLFVPGADGIFHALDADNGKTLWSHHNGLGHTGGVISYSANGKQYVAVVTGWGDFVAGNFGPLFGEPFTSMPTDNGQLLVFSLP